MILNVVPTPNFVFHPWKSPRDSSPISSFSRKISREMKKRQKKNSKIPRVKRMRPSGYKYRLPTPPSPDRIPIRPVCIRSAMPLFPKPPTPPPIEEVPISQISPNPFFHYASMNHQQKKDMRKKRREMDDNFRQCITIFVKFHVIYLFLYGAAFFYLRPPFEDNKTLHITAICILVHRVIHVMIGIAIVMRIRLLDKHSVGLLVFTREALPFLSGATMMIAESMLLLWMVQKAVPTNYWLEGGMAIVGLGLFTAMGSLFVTVSFNRLLFQLLKARKHNAELETATKVSI